MQPSSDNVLGMQVEATVTTPTTVTVRTTGAEFVFDFTRHTIECRQRLPRQRRVVTLTGLNLAGLQVQSRTNRECRLTADQLPSPIIVGLDSLLTLPLATGSSLTVTGAYAPAWTGVEKPHCLVPDQEGGVGLYLLGEAACEIPETWPANWQVRYTSHQPARLLVSVYPPRPFDWQRAGETMLHSFSCKHPCPSDQELAEFRQLGTALTLHSYIWKGSQGSEYGIWNDDSWGPTHFVPKDEKELRRVIATAHRLGLKIIPYTSPFYFTDPTQQVSKLTMPAFLEEVQTILGRYGFDGIYFDGMYNDVEAAYEVTRRVRDLIGNDGIFYVHATFLSPLRDVFCPFIDCYADYLLRGENRVLTAEYARWWLSSFNLGNTIGTHCYNTDRVTPNLIDLLFSVNARLPLWVQDGTWDKYNYFLGADEWDAIRKHYLPRLAKERAMHVRPAK